MPRIQAEDFDLKRTKIMDAAARQFADVGYPNARMMDIASACGASKSMLYHYFPAKDDLLYAILLEHLQDFIDDIKIIDESNLRGKKAICSAFTELFAHKSTKKRTRHIVAWQNVNYLPRKQQVKIKNLQHEIIELTSKTLKQINPKLSDQDYNIYSLMLFGTLSSMDMWMKPTGRYSVREITGMATEVFINGFEKV